MDAHPAQHPQQADCGQPAQAGPGLASSLACAGLALETQGRCPEPADALSTRPQSEGTRPTVAPMEDGLGYYATPPPPFLRAHQDRAPACAVLFIFAQREWPALAQRVGPLETQLLSLAQLIKLDSPVNRAVASDGLRVAGGSPATAGTARPCGGQSGGKTPLPAGGPVLAFVGCLALGCIPRAHQN
jgi:hypothetical protein